MAQEQLTRLNCPWQILLMRFHVNLCVFPQHSFYACLCHISSFPPTAYQVLPPKDTKGCQRHVHVHRTSFARAHQRRSARLGASINLESSVDISEFTIVTLDRFGCGFETDDVRPSPNPELKKQCRGNSARGSTLIQESIT